MVTKQNFKERNQGVEAFSWKQSVLFFSPSQFLLTPLVLLKKQIAWQHWRKETGSPALTCANPLCQSRRSWHIKSNIFHVIVQVAKKRLGYFCILEWNKQACSISASHLNLFMNVIYLCLIYIHLTNFPILAFTLPHPPPPRPGIGKAPRDEGCMKVQQRYCCSEIKRSLQECVLSKLQSTVVGKVGVHSTPLK